MTGRFLFIEKCLFLWEVLSIGIIDFYEVRDLYEMTWLNELGFYVMLLDCGNL